MAAGLLPKLWAPSKAVPALGAGKLPIHEVEQRPLILTLRLDADSQEFFNAQRGRFFPPELNYLQAHVTLFHHLPGEAALQIGRDLERATERHPGFHISVTGLRSLGRGAAYVLESETLASLREQLAQTWRAWLTPQDRQAFRPHVTIQNKVDPQEARKTLALLHASFEEQVIQGIGLDLWIYDGGPWEHLRTFPFVAQSDTAAGA